MARKATAAAAARERARERARGFLEREERLIELASEYEVKRVEVDEVEAEAESKALELIRAAERKADELRDQAQHDAATARDELEDIQRAMLAEGATRKDVGVRLSIPTRDVVKASSSTTKGSNVNKWSTESPEECAARLVRDGATVVFEDQPGISWVAETHDGGSYVSFRQWTDEQTDIMASVDIQTRAFSEQ